MSTFRQLELAQTMRQAVSYPCLTTGAAETVAEPSRREARARLRDQKQHLAGRIRAVRLGDRSRSHDRPTFGLRAGQALHHQEEDARLLSYASHQRGGA